MSHRSQILASASTLALLLSAASYAQTTPATANPPGNQQPAVTAELEQIVVTARRRAENLQETPVAISAYTPEALYENNVHAVQDLDTLVPGFRFSPDGGKNTDDVVMRGLDRIPLGLGIPAVVTYFADVPIPGIASNTPSYDMDNLQVLKGPQGTLFGRNTLGGAVVLTPAAPTSDYEGYIDFRAGNLGRESVEGALNIPLIDDKLILRVAGQAETGDGYVKNLSGGPDLSNTREGSYRVSLLMRPTDYIKDTLIYDYTIIPERAEGDYLYGAHPGIFGGLFAPSLGPALGQQLGANLDAQIAGYLAQQRAAGPEAGFTDLANGGLAFSREQGISNDARVDLPNNIQIRNIFGLREVYNNEEIDTGAVPQLTFPLGGLPFTLFDAGQTEQQEFLTDEMQVSGKSWDNHLTWVTGVFYNNDWSSGPSGSQFTAFSVGGVPAPAVTALVEEHNYAVYGQAGLDLSDWLLKGLTFNLGYRYSWDEVHACGGSIGTGYVDTNTCEKAAALHTAGGAGDVDATGNDPSWTIGLDYKLSDSQFFYVTSRRGYRGVNVNTPLFSSVYTTGGASPLCAGGVCPDLRPFQTTKPEKLTDVEIGSKTDWNIGGVVGRFNIAGYRSDYANALEFLNTQTLVPTVTPDSPTNGSLGINAADETIYGMEFSATIKPTSDLTFSFNGAYNDSQIDRVFSPSSTLALTKSQITLPTPKFSGTASMRWDLPVHPLDGDLIFNANVYATGRFGAQDGVELPGYSVTNTRLDLQDVAGTGLDIGFFVNNLFDRTYALAPVVLLPTFPVSSVYLGEPRTFGAELRYTFSIPKAPEAATSSPIPVPAAVTAPAAPPPVAAIEGKRSFQVFFDFGKSNLTAAATKVIAAAADAVRQGNSVQLVAVTGHTDTVGSAAYNQTLSEGRAVAVKQQLVADGVPSGEITTTGVGKSGLLVPTADGVREAQNRRAEIVLQ